MEQVAAEEEEAQLRNRPLRNYLGHTMSEIFPADHRGDRGGVGRKFEGQKVKREMKAVEGWSSFAVEQCCDILDSMRVPVNAEARDKRIGEIPYYGANGLQGYIDDFIFDEPLILIAEDGGCFDEFATRPIAYRIKGKSWVNNHAHVLRAKEAFCPDAVFYNLEHKDIQSFIVGGTRSKLNQVALRAITLTLPTSKPEQSKIAEILSTVDRAIEQTVALIAKQQHIKTGLMQDLLTRGIDEQGNLRSEQTHKFKDSPLGRIPVEWEVVGIDEIAKITTGGKDTQDRDDSGVYPFFVRSQTIEKINSFSFDGEGVLTAGDGVGVGKVFHYYKGKFDFHQRVYCVHSFANDMDGYFFFHYFRLNFMSRVSQFSAKGSVDSVRMAMIAKMLIPKPSQGEQVQSVELLCKAEVLEVNFTETLSKLRSLKTALMQDLLTGKKRVTALLNGMEVTTV